MLKGDALKRTQTRQQIPYFIADYRSFQLSGIRVFWHAGAWGQNFRATKIHAQK